MDVGTLGTGLVGVLGAEELRWSEDDGPARPDQHLFPRLRVSPAALPLLTDDECAEPGDLDLLAVAQLRLDRVEDDLDQSCRLTIRNAAVALVDNPRDV